MRRLPELRLVRRTRGLGLLLALGLVSGAGVAACGANGNTGLPGDDPGGSPGAGSDGGVNEGLDGGFITFDGGVSPEEAAESLAFDPPEATIVVDGNSTPEVSFALRARFKDGSTREVQGRTLQFDRPDVAQVTPGAPVKVRAKGTYAGTGTLNAVYGGAAAKAKVRVVVRQRELAPGVSAEAAAALDAGATSAAPNDPSLADGAFAYPYDKTVFPLGLPSPLLMWTAPGATDVYRVRLEEESYTYDYYAVPAFTAGAGKAELRIPQRAWDRVTASNRGVADPLKLTLTRYRATAGGPQVYTSVTRTFGVAGASARGAIYYWTASSDGGERVGHITKFQPGTGAAPVKLNEGKCMGCHSVSADGNTLVATVEVTGAGTPYPSVAPFSNWTGSRPWVSFALPSGEERLRTTKSGANTALTPDGKYVVFGGRTATPVSGANFLGLAETAVGDLIATSGLDAVKYDGATKGTFNVTPASMMMPAFSPDGTKLAVVEGGSGDARDNVIPKSPKAIFYLDFDRSGPAFSPDGHVIVPASASIFGTFNGDLVNPAGGNLGLGYPTFSPDSRYVAYHTGKYSTGCETGCLDQDYDTGEIWLSAVDGSRHVRLDALNGGPAANAASHLNREPTFNPAERGGYFWVVFTSMRAWGHYNGPAGTGGAPAGGDYNKLSGLPVNENRRLWVAAIDKTTGQVDPSHPAFYLEGQEEKPNMRGFWALSACIATPAAGSTGGACTSGFECCSGFCEEGRCIDPQQLACRSIGESCTTVSDCCNPSAVTCSAGACIPAPIK